MKVLLVAILAAVSLAAADPDVLAHQLARKLAVAQAKHDADRAARWHRLQREVKAINAELAAECAAKGQQPGLDAYGDPACLPPALPVKPGEPAKESAP